MCIRDRLRTHQAGALRADHVGQTVTLTGWVAKRRDHGGVAFVDLRDASGIAQVVARDEVLTGAAHDLRNEYCVKVIGEVVARTAENVNPCLLYTSDAADERSSVDLGGRRIIKKKNKKQQTGCKI